MYMRVCRNDMEKQRGQIVVLDSGGSSCKLGLAGDDASLMYVEIGSFGWLMVS